jgi:hypothetical protein
VIAADEEPFCVGTWRSDGSAMRSPATFASGEGAEAITVLGDYEAGAQLDMLIVPLPGLGLPSRFEAVFPLILAVPALLHAVFFNVLFWRVRLGD